MSLQITRIWVDEVERVLRSEAVDPAAVFLPCECDHCRWARLDNVSPPHGDRARIMAGVDMPGRIVDDVRPDQRD